MTQPSIRRKLRLVILLTSAIVLLLACGAFIAADRARASRVLEHDLSSLAEMIGANSAAPLTFDDRVAGTEVLSALRARPAIVAAVMYTRSGQPFAIYGNPEPEQLRGLPTPTSTADRIEVRFRRLACIVTHLPGGRCRLGPGRSARRGRGPAGSSG